jgi:hypothetical protein
MRLVLSTRLFLYRKALGPLVEGEAVSVGEALSWENCFNSRRPTRPRRVMGKYPGSE